MYGFSTRVAKGIVYTLYIGENQKLHYENYQGKIKFSAVFLQSQDDKQWVITN